MTPLPLSLLLLAAESGALQVVIVRDPSLPELSRAVVDAALVHAQKEYEVRFGVAGPPYVVANEMSVSGFLGAYALPVDPICKPLYGARYRGGGKAELLKSKDAAIAFFKRWSLESLRGFVAEQDRRLIKTYDDVFAYYVEHYSRSVEAMKGIETANGEPLVTPGRSTKRSFAAWTCAMRRQPDYDVILTNAFILADLMNEPHPHAVFGKAKVGGIASSSPSRAALGGEALLATTFGIDTRLERFKELDEVPTFEQRAKILGAYLLAHEVAHAEFGIPDVFDHPPGCLMTTRPGATYLDGLRELEANVRPCEKCQPYVRSRTSFVNGRAALEAGQPRKANVLFTRALKQLPKHVHGGRKKRVSAVLVYASKAMQALGRRERAKNYAKLAKKLDPTSSRAIQQWQLVASSTSTTAR